ncbi:MAG: metallophosphoesterase [Ignavibacteriales bacterium]
MSWVLKAVLFLSAIMILMSSYVGWRVTGAINQVTNWNQIYIKWMVLVVVIYLFIYPILGLVGNLFNVQGIIYAMRDGNKVIDYFFMYPFWFGLVFVSQLGILLFGLEMARFLVSLVYKSHFIQLKMAHAWLVVILTGATVVYVTAKIYLDTKTVKTVEIKVKIPNLPDDLHGFRIVHISDIQADNRTVESRMERYINAVNKLEPDIVIFTGDLVTYGTEYIQIGAEMMGRIKSKYGIYACLGDHDYWSNPKQIVRSLKERGVVFFEDRNIPLGIRSSTVYMTLVTNIYSKHPNGDILKTLASQINGSALKIFITHQPSPQLIEFAAKNHYDIFLAGHTHGGQVALWLFGIKLAPALFETSYLSGQYRLGSMFINVNNGLGLTLAPIRYNAPASVTLIELESQGHFAKRHYFRFFN